MVNTAKILAALEAPLIRKVRVHKGKKGKVSPRSAFVPYPYSKIDRKSWKGTVADRVGPNKVKSSYC